MSSAMNIEFYTMTLWIAVIWPLVLSIPSLHSRLPWPRHLALLPAAVLTVIPIDVSIEIPWLLYGTGFAIDGNIRWILGAVVVIWFAAATISLPAKEKASSNYSTTFYLLSLAGSLGVLLTTELVAFFSFSTLMGYSFYALLIQNGNSARQRAGRLYLYVLIVADIALFEALLLVAFTTEHFQYEMVRQTMADISSSSVYFYMVLIGFFLKAAIWPFYFWLTAAFKSGSRTIALLLIAGPVTMSLLGLLRWLPVRDDIYRLGLIMQLLGAAAILHSALKIFTSGIFKQGLTRFNTTWLIVAFTGLLSFALGTTMQNPTLSQHYSYIVYPTISAFSLSLSLLILTTVKIHSEPESVENRPVLIINTFHKLKKWLHSTQQLASGLKLKTLALWDKSGSFVIKQYQHICSEQKIKFFVTDWKTNITLFLILGLAITWLAI